MKKVPSLDPAFDRAVRLAPKTHPAEIAAAESMAREDFAAGRKCFPAGNAALMTAVRVATPPGSKAVPPVGIAMMKAYTDRFARLTLAS